MSDHRDDTEPTPQERVAAHDWPALDDVLESRARAKAAELASASAAREDAAEGAPGAEAPETAPEADRTAEVAAPEETAAPDTAADSRPEPSRTEPSEREPFEPELSEPDPTAPNAARTPRADRHGVERGVDRLGDHHPVDGLPADRLPGDTAPMPAVPDTTDDPAAPADRTIALNRTPNREHPNGTPFLIAKGLSAKGRHGPIFTGIDLTAGLGQVVAVCGDSGDGRTSLLLALAGRFAVHTGTLQVDGQRTPGQIRRRFTIAQAGPPIHFDEYHTVASCIKETTAVSGGTATSANIHAWLDRLALAVDTGDTYGFLPRIDQITFAIACAAASRTPAVVVDDTDTGLDRCGSERVFEALRTVADAGQLVLAACTRSDPPSDTVVDLRGLSEPPRRHEGRTRKGGHQ